MLDPWPSLDQLWLERDREARDASAQKYIDKFKPMFDAIQAEITRLEVFAAYDSSAREAALILAGSLEDARTTIASGAW